MLQVIDNSATTQGQSANRAAQRWPNGNRSLFNSERARLAGKASVEARRAKKLLPEPDLPLAVPAPVPKPANPLGTEQDLFRGQSLPRVRRSIRNLHAQLDEEIQATEGAKARCSCGDWVVLPLPDSKRIKEMADSLYRLSELERQLAGRPLPGSLKPVQERTRSRSSVVQPIE